MSHKIDKIDHFPKGDTKIIPFSIIDGETDSALDLAGADIEWQLRKYKDSDVLLDLSDSGVSVQNLDETNGEFEIRIEKGVTSDFDEDTYRQRLRILDGSDPSNQTTWFGEVEIDSNA